MYWWISTYTLFKIFMDSLREGLCGLESVGTGENGSCLSVREQEIARTTRKENGQGEGRELNGSMSSQRTCADHSLRRCVSVCVKSHLWIQMCISASEVLSVVLELSHGKTQNQTKPTTATHTRFM